MSIVLEKDRVLLVEGPASVVIHEGRVNALGAPLPTGKAVIIRKGKVLPLEAEENARLKVTSSNDHSAILVEGSTIPESWRRAISQIEEYKLSTTMVLGASDCGKNTFCIALANRLLKQNLRVAIVDGDVGQSDIGPPGAVSFSVIKQPVYDLFELDPNSVVFVGNTSPSAITGRVLSALAALNNEVRNEQIPRLIVNTDGWVSDAEAVDFKLRVAKIFSPDAVVGIQNHEELEPILSRLESDGNNIIRVETPPVVYHRSREIRRELREQCFRKFLSNASIKTLPVGWLRLEHTFLGETDADAAISNIVSQLLKTSVVRCISTSEGLRVVLPRNTKVDKASILDTEKALKMSLRIVFEGDEKGLVVALLDKDRRFGGLGTVHSIDFRRGVIKLLTPYQRVPSIIQFGRIRLDESGKERGYTDDFEL
ncbi:MAG: Clp1/GlmU family protein [Candidatus Bathyarchaeia archaeon]